MSLNQRPTRLWDTRRQEKRRRIASMQGQTQGKVIPTADLTAVPQASLIFQF